MNPDPLALRLAARLTVILLLISGNVFAEGLPSATELLDLWQERTRPLHNAVIEWESVETTDPSMLFGKEGPTAPSNEPPVKSAFVRTLQCRLVTDGGRWKMTESGPRWNNKLERVVPTAYGMLQDEETYTILDDKSIDGADLAFVHSHERGNAITSAPSLAAYFLLINPFHPRLGQLSPKRYEVSSVTSEEFLDNHECVVISFHHRRDDLVSRVALAHDLDWLPVRWELGKIAMVEFHYDSKNAESILPSGWTTKIVHATSGSVQNATQSTVKRWESPSSIPDSEFRLPFPTGTVVWDYRHRVDGVPDNFVIRENGTHRAITQEERQLRVDAKTLMNTGPNERVARASSQETRLWLLVCLAAPLVVIVVVYLGWLPKVGR